MARAANPRDRLWAAAVLLGAALLYFGRLGECGVVSEEQRWAAVAREMRLTGDYLHPSINGQTYYDKPLGSYWLIVAASFVTGGVNETAARLPAAVAGWLGVLLTMSLGRRLYGARVGILAGAILATSFGFAFYARRATADLETVTGVLAAVWLYAKYHDRGAGLWVVGLWTLMAATSLTKGLLGFALPTAVFLVHSSWVGRREHNSWRGALHGQRWLLGGWSLVAIPLGLILFLTPFAASMHQTGSTTGLELLFRENIRRFVAPHNHTGPFYLYAEVIFVLLAPWSLFLPAALLAPRQTDASGDALARIYFWTVFAFFTVSASRRNYYLLPILPAASLLVARTLVAGHADLPVWVQRLRTLGYGLFAVALPLAGVLLLSPADHLPAPWDALPNLPARTLFAIGWIACLAALAWGWSRCRFLPATLAATFAATAFAFLVAIPELDALRPRRSFVAEVRERSDLTGLVLFHARDIAFDLAAPWPLPEYRDAAALSADLRSGDISWVVARRRSLSDTVLPAQIVLEERNHPWERDDRAGDKLILLKAYAK